MKTDLGLERCLTFINCEIQPPTLRHSKQGKYTAITISRQAGAGGHAVAEELRELLQERAKGPGCGRDQSKGGTAPDTAFGDVPEAGQVPGQGRIDRGGGATADGYKPDSITNYTEPGSGLQRTN